MKLIFGVGAMLLPLLSFSEPLHPGAALPDITCHNVVNYRDTTISLSSFKGKAVIIDFWATWCSSCVRHLPAMDSLQQQFEGNVQFILVSTAATGDTRSKVEAFISGHKGTILPLAIPIVTGDTVLARLFPHLLLPHYVWVNARGIVVAITGAEPVSAANIKELLRTDSLQNLPYKQDVMNYNKRIPLLQDGNGGDYSQMLFSCSLTRYLPGIGGGCRIEEDALHKKITYLNMPVLALYQAALGVNANRILLHANDSTRFFTMDEAATAWQQHRFCFELTVPAATTQDRMNQIMINGLNYYLNLRGHWETLEVRCYDLIKTALHIKKGKAASSSGYNCLISNEPVSILAEQLNTQLATRPFKPIFFDNTGDSSRVTIGLHSLPADIPGLQKELQSYGLALVPATHEITMYVISEQ
ncbi:MAG TPA: TlpA disulfide reductase family protein [Chitinophagaceae bacterium]|nr:TlpA disulfide reductase family protein [Chitinophagaceae bacterium]